MNVSNLKRRLNHEKQNDDHEHKKLNENINRLCSCGEIFIVPSFCEDIKLCIRCRWLHNYLSFLYNKMEE